MRVNESHSGYWMLSTMYGLDMNIANYPWKTSPVNASSYWMTEETKAGSTSNVDAGTVIGASILGLNPRNIKTRNAVADLVSKQNEAGLFFTIWGESWAMIALDLVNGEYRQEQHIRTLLEVQNKQTGYFGSLDSTGWILMALASHRDKPEVEAAIQKAVKGYNEEFKKIGFTDNANTMSAIISGLASVGEDVFSEKWTYEKDGKKVNIVGHLIENYIFDDGGVRWMAMDKKSNLMAVEQVYLALADAIHQKSTFVRLKEDSQSTAPVEPDPDPDEGGEGPEQPTEPENPPGPVTGTATMSISTSGVVLPSEQFEILADETAFDFLKRVTTQKQISLNYRHTSMGYYVVGIAGINEFDRGPLSGWMYRVNGIFPTVSADSYQLAPGDIVQWVYTEDLGEDVGGGTGDNEPGSDNEEDKETKPDSEKLTDPINPNTSEDGEIEVPVEENLDYLQATLTNEQITAGGKKFVIHHKNGTTVELPTAALKLTDNETAVVSVQQTGQIIDIQLSASTKDGPRKDLALGKAYAKVTIPAPQATAKTVVLQLINGEYRAVPHQIVNGEIILFVKTSGSFILVEESITFDDIQQLANKDDIEFLASRHIVKGKDAGTFAPNEPITRAQFAAMISRALGLQAEGTSKFTDTKGKWYENDVQALFEAGITNGKTASTFDPEVEITRQQAAAFMARILDYVNYEVRAGKLDFKDARKN